MALSFNISRRVLTFRLALDAVHPSPPLKVVSSGTKPTVDICLTYAGDYIKVTCATSTLTHYYVVHSGDPIIHMATHTTAGELTTIKQVLTR